MEGCGRSQTGSIKWATTPPQGGDHDKPRARVLAAPGLSTRLGQATDLSVAQPVVDESEKFTGGGHSADAVASPLCDTAAMGRYQARAAPAAHRLHRHPADQAAALFGDMPPMHGGVRLPMPRREPRPRAQSGGGRETADVADLGHYAVRAIMPNGPGSGRWGPRLG